VRPCKLCGKTAELQESHVSMPEFVIPRRSMTATTDELPSIHFNPADSRKIQKGLRTPALSRVEQLFEQQVRALVQAALVRRPPTAAFLENMDKGVLSIPTHHFKLFHLQPGCFVRTLRVMGSGAKSIWETRHRQRLKKCVLTGDSW